MSLTVILMPLMGLIKARSRTKKADIDSPFFKLHYRTTATICYLCSILVTASELFGGTIDCVSNSVQRNVLNTYCWIMSTFSVPSQPGQNVGEHYAYQGVAPLYPEQPERRLHAYYQWVPFVLFFQGLLFYAPHYIWKVMENRKIDKITNGLRNRMLDHKQASSSVDALVNYMTETFHMHDFYVFKYIVCDLLNVVNVVGQMFLLNKFLGGVFLAYGTDVLYWTEKDTETRTDPLMDVFPRLTKCTFHKYGASGTMEEHDALCLLALNIINEKIYIFMWFWFIILAVITLLQFVYVMAMINLPSLRRVLLERNMKQELKGTTLLDKAHIGDWFVMFLISNNVDSALFADFVKKFTKKLNSTQ